MELRRAPVEARQAIISDIIEIEGPELESRACVVRVFQTEFVAARHRLLRSNNTVLVSGWKFVAHSSSGEPLTVENQGASICTCREDKDITFNLWREERMVVSEPITCQKKKEYDGEAGRRGYYVGSSGDAGMMKSTRPCNFHRDTSTSTDIRSFALSKTCIRAHNILG